SSERPTDRAVAYCRRCCGASPCALSSRHWIGQMTLTHDDLAAIPLFSALSPANLAELVRGAADIHLNKGEYVVNEGEEAALFVVLAGCMEVTKLIDGIERTVGKRAPGKIFGEVPLIYGTPFQSNCRAAEPSRV